MLLPEAALVLAGVLKQPVFDRLHSLTACVGACLNLPAPTCVRVCVCAELEEEASRPEKDSKTLSSDLIEYVQHMIREHGDNFKVSETCRPPVLVERPRVSTLLASCLSRRWPEMRRTITRTRPNRSGGKWRSTSGATQSSSAPSWSRWAFPGRRACRASPGVTYVWTGQDRTAPGGTDFGSIRG